MRIKEKPYQKDLIKESLVEIQLNKNEEKKGVSPLNKRNRSEMNLARNSPNITKINDSLDYSKNEIIIKIDKNEYVDKTIDHRTPYEPHKVLRPSMTSNDGDISSTVFITTRPSENAHSKSLIQKESRNIPIGSQGIPNHNIFRSKLHFR